MVGIIILNYNNTTDILSCVKSVLSFTDKEIIRIIVVDNGSSRKIQDYVGRELAKISGDFLALDDIPQDESRLPLMTYLRLPDNIGYARGNNAGIELLNRYGDIRYVLICNSDILFTSDIISPLIDEYQKNKNIGTLSPILYRLDGSIDLSCARSAYETKDLTFTFSYLFSALYKSRIRSKQLLLQHPEYIDRHLVEIGMPSGSCMLFSKEVLGKIKGFDPNTFLYYEEAILCEKLKRIGKNSYLIPAFSCIHTGGATTKSTKTSFFLKKCNLDSLLYFISTYKRVSPFTIFYILITGKISLIVLKILTAVKRQLSFNHNY